MADLTTSPSLFPPRGPGRPSMRQVLSDPGLRPDYLGLEDKNLDTDTEEDFGSILRHLDELAARRRKDRGIKPQSERDAARAAERQRAQWTRAVDPAAKLVPDRPAWTYADPPGFFQAPMIERDQARMSNKNPFMNGIYETADPNWRPPHFESNVKGGWNYHSRNERGEMRGEFGTKAESRLGPGELKYLRRLEKTLERTKEQELTDTLAKFGTLKKNALVASAPEFSALKGGKAKWKDQKSANHVYFSNPEPYKPGEHQYDEGILACATQPSRAMNFQRDFIGGDAERTSHWKAPKGGAMHGTARKLKEAEALLLPSGVKKLRERY